MVSSPQVFLPKPCMHFFSLQYVLHAQFVTPFLIWYPNDISWKVKSRSCSLWNIPNHSHFSSIVDPNIFLVIFLNTLSVYSSFHIGDQVSYPYKTRGKIINVNKNPTGATVCRYLFTAKLLYMFRVSQHPSLGVLKTVPAASCTVHTTCTATPLQRGLIWTRPDQTRPDQTT